MGLLGHLRRCRWSAVKADGPLTSGRRLLEQGPSVSSLLRTGSVECRSHPPPRSMGPASDRPRLRAIRVNAHCRLAQVLVADLGLIPAAQHRFAVGVVLELQPVGTGILNKQGVMLQRTTGVAALGGHREEAAPALQLQPELLPTGEGLKDQPEMSGIDPRLPRLQKLGRVLQDQLVALEVKNRGLLTPAPGLAVQGLDVPVMTALQVNRRNREMKARPNHGVPLGQDGPGETAVAGFPELGLGTQHRPMQAAEPMAARITLDEGATRTVQLQLATQRRQLQLSPGAMGWHSVGGMKHGLDPLKRVPPV